MLKCAWILFSGWGWIEFTGVGYKLFQMFVQIGVFHFTSDVVEMRTVQQSTKSWSIMRSTSLERN